MAEIDPRVGVWVNGVPVFPKVSISGQAYTRPANTRDLPDGRFVVVDLFQTVDVEETIRELTAEVAAIEAPLEVELKDMREEQAEE